MSRRALEMSSSGGSVRAASMEVRLVMVEECGVLVRLMGRMSTTMRGHCCGWRLQGECIWH
jgi:hypothetical protein